MLRGRRKEMQCDSAEKPEMTDEASMTPVWNNLFRVSIGPSVEFTCILVFDFHVCENFFFFLHDNVFFAQGKHAAFTVSSVRV